jgi:hypothetical protein
VSLRVASWISLEGDENANLFFDGTADLHPRSHTKSHEVTRRNFHGSFVSLRVASWISLEGD